MLRTRSVNTQTVCHISSPTSAIRLPVPPQAPQAQASSMQMQMRMAGAVRQAARCALVAATIPALATRGRGCVQVRDPARVHERIVSHALSALSWRERGGRGGEGLARCFALPQGRPTHHHHCPTDSTLATRQHVCSHTPVPCVGRIAQQGHACTHASMLALCRRAHLHAHAPHTPRMPACVHATTTQPSSHTAARRAGQCSRTGAQRSRSRKHASSHPAPPACCCLSLRRVLRGSTCAWPCDPGALQERGWGLEW